MRAKKILTILSSTLLLTLASNALAADVTCPAPDKIRGLGSDFLYAYNSENYKWVLVSDSFSWRDKDWQTLFTIDIPHVVNPSIALEAGQEAFNKSPLLTEPSIKTLGNKTECSYAPNGAHYQVVTATPVGFGIKKR